MYLLLPPSQKMLGVLLGDKTLYKSPRGEGVYTPLNVSMLHGRGNCVKTLRAPGIPRERKKRGGDKKTPIFSPRGKEPH